MESHNKALVKVGQQKPEGNLGKLLETISVWDPRPHTGMIFIRGLERRGNTEAVGANSIDKEVA